jgi:hypothetical protein
MTNEAQVRGEAPGLKGISGKLRLKVAEAAAGVLQIEPSGVVEIVKEGDTTAVVAVDAQDTLTALLRGEMNPIVAHLQDRLLVEGDVALALRVLFGLQAGSPWSDVTRRT